MVWAMDETRDVSDLTISDMVKSADGVRLLYRFSLVSFNSVRVIWCAT